MSGPISSVAGTELVFLTTGPTGSSGRLDGSSTSSSATIRTSVAGQSVINQMSGPISSVAGTELVFPTTGPTGSSGRLYGSSTSSSATIRNFPNVELIYERTNFRKSVTGVESFHGVAIPSAVMTESVYPSEGDTLQRSGLRFIDEGKPGVQLQWQSSTGYEQGKSDLDRHCASWSAGVL